ncbi:MAG: short-chain dehydrogenase [Verrucomicrobia bacterium]|nr:MAG: short-chain dehydrogenase [Verrucomicrobiota bacterium]
MQYSLQGKTALVTGASRGIGRAIALRLALDGAMIAIHYGGNDAAANETLKAIEQTGGQAFLVKAELGVDGDIETLFSKLEKGLTGPQLDILVNNAAVAPQIALDQTTPEEFDRIFAINVRAPFFITQRAIPLMTDGGRIINISSGVTWFATPATVYSMTKGALNVLSRSLANSLGSRNITVNTISPGITDTDMNPSIRDKDVKAVERVTRMTALGRPGRPTDIADAVAFLASDDGRWITGQTLEVNGGLFLGPRE